MRHLICILVILALCAIGFHANTDGEPVAAAKDAKPAIEGPRYVAYDHASVIHVFDRLGQLKPPGKGDAHPHIPEHFQYTLHGCMSGDAEFAVFSALRALQLPGRNSLDLYLWERQSNKVVPLNDANTFEHEDHPSISADGKLIAFRTQDVGARTTAGIRLLDRKAGRLDALPNMNFNSNTGIPALSPDGRLLAFSAVTAEGDRDVYVYDRKAQSLVELPGVNSASDDWSPRVSKDGDTLVFCSRRGGKHASVYIYDRKASQLVDDANLRLTAEQLEIDLSADARFVGMVINRREFRLHDRQTGKLVELPGLYHQGGVHCTPSLSRE